MHLILKFKAFTFLKVSDKPKFFESNFAVKKKLKNLENVEKNLLFFKVDKKFDMK
jgi:hypothetical protein